MVRLDRLLLYPQVMLGMSEGGFNFGGWARIFQSRGIEDRESGASRMLYRLGCIRGGSQAQAEQAHWLQGAASDQAQSKHRRGRNGRGAKVSRKRARERVLQRCLVSPCEPYRLPTTVLVAWPKTCLQLNKAPSQAPDWPLLMCITME